MRTFLKLLSFASLLVVHIYMFDVVYAKASCLKNFNEFQKKMASLQREVICASGTDFNACKKLFEKQNSEKEVVGNQNQLELTYCPAYTGDGSGGVGYLAPIPATALTSLVRVMNKIEVRQYVNSVEDFVQHTRLHKKRVELLGQKLLQMYPKYFEGITPEMLQTYLSVHDDAKMNDFFDELYKYFGKAAPRELIDDLNNRDDEYLKAALKKLGLEIKPGMSPEEIAAINDKISKLKILEKLPDIVDRGKSFVTPEEMGRAVKHFTIYMRFAGETSDSVAEILEIVKEGRHKNAEKAIKAAQVEIGHLASKSSDKEVRDSAIGLGKKLKTLNETLARGEDIGATYEEAQKLINEFSKISGNKNSAQIQTLQNALASVTKSKQEEAIALFKKAQKKIGSFVSKSMDKEERTAAIELGKKIKGLGHMVARGEDISDAVKGVEDIWSKFKNAMDLGADAEIQINMALNLEKEYAGVVKGHEYVHLTPQERAIVAEVLANKRAAKKLAQMGEKKTFMLSMKALAKQSVLKTSSSVLAVLDSPLFARAVAVGEVAIGLMKDVFNKVGCSEKPGYYDWEKRSFFSEKGSGCQIAKALTPKFVDFISLPDSQQIAAIKDDDKICSVIDDVYKQQQKKRYDTIQCSPGQVNLKINKDKGIAARFDEQGKIRHFDVKGFKKTLHGELVAADLNENGNLQKLCYKNNYTNKVHCLPFNKTFDPSSAEKEIETLLGSFRFDLEQSRNCCEGNYNSSATDNYCNKVAKIEHINSSSSIDHLQKIGLMSAQ